MEFAKVNLKLDYLDEPTWRELSKKYLFRLPSWYQPATQTRYIKRLFKHVGMDIQDYLEACGVKSLKELNTLNPNEPAFASVGFALEWVEEIKDAN
ncbi:hypothetical protein D3C79_993410 [compost metagenome]